MRKLVLILLFFVLQVTLFSQRVGVIRGIIRDKQTNVILPGATVSMKQNSLYAVTNGGGYFIFSNVNPGDFILTISYIGYETLEISVSVKESDTATINAGLNLIGQMGNEVVVAASKRPEKITNAPASIHKIGIKDLDQFSGSNVQELLSGIQGLEFVRSGIDYAAINARGFNRASNNKVFQIVDGRNSMTTISTGLPLYNNVTVNKIDIESIEIVLGPLAALYGPNVHNALIYATTKDPRKYQGTTVTISAGNHYQFSARFRQATRINNRWAYKLTGEYAAGKDFEFYDSVYAGNQTGTTPFYGPPIAIPERSPDFNFRHIRGEGQVYYSLTKKADIIISGGGSDNSFIGVTNGGRNQMQGIKTGFLQGRFVHPNYFVNIYNSWGNIGDSYSISSYTRDFWNRTHSTITDPTHPLYKNFGYLPPDSAELFAKRMGKFKEQNQRLNAEAQYKYSFQKQGLFLVAGVSYQKEKPNTFGYSLVDKNQRISVTQYGGVLQLEKSLPWEMRFIGAARFDNHSNFGNFFSPKFALTKKIGESNFRITWARAYSMPSIFFQFANGNDVTFGNGPAIKYIPNGSRVGEGASAITTALVPEEISTWEFGYKGIVYKKLFIDLNGYHGLSKNFLGPPQSVGGRAMFVGDIPVAHNPAFAGKVENDTLKNALFNTFFNYGDVRAYGVDVGLNYYFSSKVSLAIKYSWFDSDIAADDPKNDANGDKNVSLEEISLNAPNHRGVASLNFQNLCKQKLFVNLSARFVKQYDFYSGSQIGTEAGEGKRGIVYRDPLPPFIKNFDWGPLGGFATIDLSAGYKINKMVHINMGITNLFDTKQMEFVGSPSIGRLIMFELKVHVPNSSKEKK